MQLIAIMPISIYMIMQKVLQLKGRNIFVYRIQITQIRSFTTMKRH